MGHVHIKDDDDHAAFVFIRDLISGAADVVRRRRVGGREFIATASQYWPPHDAPQGNVVGVMYIYMIERPVQPRRITGALAIAYAAVTDTPIWQHGDKFDDQILAGDADDLERAHPGKIYVEVEPTIEQLERLRDEAFFADQPLKAGEYQDGIAIMLGLHERKLDLNQLTDLDDLAVLRKCADMLVETFEREHFG
jgi:hypothetical protein